jgi:antitoxin (DNA-binding transcriptional repressor) of toxin-antitoxin stability system
VTTISVTEARAKLPEIIDRVAAGDEVTITRHGQPVAVVLRPDAVRARRSSPVFAQAAELHEALERARREPRRPRPVMSPEYAEEMIKEIRAGRDSR